MSFTYFSFSLVFIGSASLNSLPLFDELISLSSIYNSFHCCHYVLYHFFVLTLIFLCLSDSEANLLVYWFSTWPNIRFLFMAFSASLSPDSVKRWKVKQWWLSLFYFEYCICQGLWKGQIFNTLPGPAWMLNCSKSADHSSTVRNYGLYCAQYCITVLFTYLFVCSCFFFVFVFVLWSELVCFVIDIAIHIAVAVVIDYYYCYCSIWFSCHHFTTIFLSLFL